MFLLACFSDVSRFSYNKCVSDTPEERPTALALMESFFAALSMQRNDPEQWPVAEIGTERPEFKLSDPSLHTSLVDSLESSNSSPEYELRTSSGKKERAKDFKRSLKSKNLLEE